MQYEIRYTLDMSFQDGCEVTHLLAKHVSGPCLILAVTWFEHLAIAHATWGLAMDLGV